MKLAFGVPWGSPFVYAQVLDTLMSLRRPAGFDTKFFRGYGWCPAARHIDLCRQAVNWGADYIVLLGADQLYEEDLLERLMGHASNGYGVVGALVPTRGWIEWIDMKPFQPMAWRFKYNDPTGPALGFEGIAKDQSNLEMLQPNTGMQIANFIGSGVLMFHRDILLALKKPWFHETMSDPKEYKRRACMDTKFSFRLQREGGAELWVDTDIKVKHLHIFQIDDTFQDRFDDWKTDPDVGDKEIIEWDRGGVAPTTTHE